MARRTIGLILAATLSALFGIVGTSAPAWATQPAKIATYDAPIHMYDDVPVPALVSSASDLRRGPPHRGSVGGPIAIPLAGVATTPEQGWCTAVVPAPRRT